MSPLVEIGLTDLPKSGCTMAHPAHPGTTPLLYKVLLQFTILQVLLKQLHNNRDAAEIAKTEKIYNDQGNGTINISTYAIDSRLKKTFLRH